MYNSVAFRICNFGGEPMKSWARAMSFFVLGGVLTGCVTQMQAINVTNTVPADQALMVLKNLDATFNAPAHAIGAPQCEYSANGMAGSKVQYLLIGSTASRQGAVAYDQWWVDEIRMVKGMAGPFYTVLVKNPDGSVCTPLRSIAGTPETTVMPKIEEALTALVSLGVAYNPNRLGRSR